jgi:predicted 2-oxoglutarate/Fe(II)-dependent dioxygenase YbiX
MGGELVIHNNGKKEEIVLRKGQTIKISDDVVHSVNRVDWGERRTLIHWFKQ